MKTLDEYWHGTANGYNNRGCRCDKCRAGWAQHVQGMKARRAAAAKDPNDPRHGTASFYGNHSCRCAACTAAWAEARGNDRKRRAVK